MKKCKDNCFSWNAWQIKKYEQNQVSCALRK